MLTAFKHVADDNFVFQQDSTPAYCTVQLPPCKNLSFLSSELWPPIAQGSNLLN